jgi:hypothetical protein
MLPNSERRINSYLNVNTTFNTSEGKPLHVAIGKTNIKINPAISSNEEKIFPSRIIELITTFKEGTMTIYDALISDKKILFIGDASTSCEKLCNFVFSCIDMVGSTSLLKRLHPYKNLYDLDFLKVTNSVYAVTNPIFKNKTDCWDIMCEIDTGKIIQSEKYKTHAVNINKESDQFFVKELLYKIKNEGISEYEIERYFKLYTNHIFRITGEQYFIDDNSLTNEANKQYKRKVLLQTSQLWRVETEMDKLRTAINCNGRNVKTIGLHLNGLFYRKNIEREELLLIYRDINRFLDNEHFVNIVTTYLNYIVPICSIGLYRFRVHF